MNADEREKALRSSVEEGWFVLAFFILLLAATIWVYRFVPTFEFVNLDDHLLIFQDYSVRHFDWHRAFTSPSAGLYHPVTTMTFLLENLVFGLGAEIYHLNNLILHLANIILVYVLVFDLIKKRSDAFWLAAFFALSPLSVESVAWVAERKDVLSTFFFLLACLMYIRTQREGKLGLYWVLTTIFVTGAFLSKPSTVVLPVIFLWIDWTQNRTFSLANVLSKAPFFLGSIATFSINWLVQTDLRGQPNWPEPMDVLTGPLQALAFYVVKILVPTDLSISYPSGENLLSLWQWMTVGIYLATLCWTAWDRTYRRPILLSLAWFGIMLVPMLKIVPFGDHSPVNDRFMYLAGLGLAHTFWTIWKKIESMVPSSFIGRSFLPLVPAVFLVFYAHLARERTLAWRSTETIWTAVLKTYPEDGRAHANLARYYQSTGRINESIYHFQKAIEFKGDKIAVLLADLAYLHIEHHRDQDARNLLERARLEDPTDPRVLNIEGVYLWRHGDISTAEKKLREALARPSGLSAAEQRAKILNNLGLVLTSKGDFSGAIEMYQKALDLQPDVASTVYNLGLVYLNSNNLNAAVTAFHRAAAIDPQLGEAWADLGVAYFAKADLEKSAYYLKKAVETSPNHSRARRNLSLVLTKMGQCKDAQALLQMAPGDDRNWDMWPQEVKSCNNPR